MLFGCGEMKLLDVFFSFIFCCGLNGLVCYSG